MALRRQPAPSLAALRDGLVATVTGAALVALVLGGQGAPAAGAAPQVAQLGPGGTPGMLNAVAYDQVTPGLSIAVRPFDDTDLNLAVKARFEEELRRVNRSTSPNAVLVLSFGTEVIRGRFSEDRRDLGRFEAGTGAGAELQFNVWSSSRDSLLGGRQKSGEREPNVFHLDAVLRDERTGKTLWQGDAYYAMMTADPLRIARSMVRPMVLNLGRTVQKMPFELE